MLSTEPQWKRESALGLACPAPKKAGANNGGLRPRVMPNVIQTEGITRFRRRTEMRMLLAVKIPHETFNAAVRNGSAGDKLKRIMEATKPEAVYFTECGGQRGAIMVVNLDDP